MIDPPESQIKALLEAKTAKDKLLKQPNINFKKPIFKIWEENLHKLNHRGNLLIGSNKRQKRFVDVQKVKSLTCMQNVLKSLYPSLQQA